MNLFITTLLSCFVGCRLDLLSLVDTSDTSNPYIVLPLLTTLQHTWTSGLFYRCDEQDLLFVDRKSDQIRRLPIGHDPLCNGSTLAVDVGSSFVIPVQGHTDRFIITQKNSLLYVVWPYQLDDQTNSNFHTQSLIATVKYYNPTVLLNEGKADFYGNLVLGTYPFQDSQGNYPLNLASLFYFNLGRAGKAGVTELLSDVSYSYDVEWTSDYRVLYFCESYSACIYSFQYDLITGFIWNRETVFCFADYGISGVPQGMTIDKNGHLYIAANGGGVVVIINPFTRELLQCVSIPAKAVTDVVFGFSSLDVLLVSTRCTGDPLEPLAGSIFTVKGLGGVGRCGNEAVMNADVTPSYISPSSRNF